MKLIGSYSCSFVRKISVILLEKNLPFTLIHAQGESHNYPSLIAEYLE